MVYYINGVVIVLLLWLAIGAWRLRHRRVTPGAAAAGMMEELLNNDRRAAIEIIVDEKAAYQDPEDRDGNLPELSGGSHASRSSAPRAVAAIPAPRPRQPRRDERSAASPAFRRGIAFGVLAWAAVCGLATLAVDWRLPMPSYLTVAATLNLALGAAGSVVVYRREQRIVRHRVSRPQSF